MSKEETAPRLSSSESKQHILIALLAMRLFKHFKYQYNMEWLKKLIHRTMESLPTPPEHSYYCNEKMVKHCIKDVLRIFSTKRVVWLYLYSQDQYMEEVLIKIFGKRVQELLLLKKSKGKRVLLVVACVGLYLLFSVGLLVMSLPLI